MYKQQGNESSACIHLKVWGVRAPDAAARTLVNNDANMVLGFRAMFPK